MGKKKLKPPVELLPPPFTPEKMEALRQWWAEHDPPPKRRPRGWRYIEEAQRELDQHTPPAQAIALPPIERIIKEDDQRYSTGRSIDGKPGH